MSFLFDTLADKLSIAMGANIDYVLGANEAGSIIAFEVAKRLHTKVAIARQKDHRYRLIDGFSFQHQERVLIV